MHRAFDPIRVLLEILITTDPSFHLHERMRLDHARSPENSSFGGNVLRGDQVWDSLVFPAYFRYGTGPGVLDFGPTRSRRPVGPSRDSTIDTRRLVA